MAKIAYLRKGQLVVRRFRVRTRESTYTRRGFLDSEARLMSEMSAKRRETSGVIQGMMRHRTAILRESQKSELDIREYNERIYQDYLNMGCRNRIKGETFAHYFKDNYYTYLDGFKKYRANKQLKNPGFWADAPDYDEQDGVGIKFTLKKGENKVQKTRLKSLYADREKFDQAMIRVTGVDPKEYKRLERERNEVQYKIDEIERNR